MRAVALLVVLAACARGYSGPARATSERAITEEPGFVIADAPTLHQRGVSDCGPTALAIVAARWGVAPARALAVASRPRADDVSFAQLRDAAQALGLTAFVIAADPATLAHELARHRPVVIGLVRRYGARTLRGHYEVVVAIAPARRLVATIDPGSGWRLRSFAELDAEWRPAHRAAMVVVGREASGLRLSGLRSLR